MKHPFLFLILLLFISSFVVLFSCRKDDPVNEEPPGEEPTEYKINEESKSESISSQSGGTIELADGIILEIPAQAMNSTTQITVETVDPFKFISNTKHETEGINVSPIVICQPTGLQFSKPVKITIPYFTELIPREHSEDNFVVIAYSDNSTDTLTYTIDKASKLVIAETTHFSEFKIEVKKKSKISVFNPKIGQNGDYLTLSFDNTMGMNWMKYYFIEAPAMSTSSLLYQEFWNEIGLYRKRTLAKDEFITGKQIYKALLTAKSEGKKFTKGDKAESQSFYEFGEFNNNARLAKDREIFDFASNTKTDVAIGVTNEVIFDAGENVSEINYRDLGENIDEDNFLKQLNVDGQNAYLDIIKLSDLDKDEKYYFKIRVASYGNLGNDYGTFESSTFKITDVNQSLSENQLPEVTINYPANNQTFVQGTNISFSGDVFDFEDGEICCENLRWESSKDGFFATGNDVKYANLSVNTHEIRLWAEDLSGNKNYRVVNINIVEQQDDTEDPVVEILSPNENETLSGTISFTAQANDNIGITNVIFLIAFNNDWIEEIGTDQTPENGDEYSVSLNTTRYDDGEYILLVSATDENGNNGNGQTTIKIDNSSGGTTTETGTFTDSRDGHTYKWVKIGEQIWMAENLAYLPDVYPSTEQSSKNPYYYVNAYEGTNVSEAKTTENYNIYGVLYNWPAAIISCPNGWHLPTDNEWKKLEIYIGMSQNEVETINWRGIDEGMKLKTTSGWYSNGNGTDNFEFSGLPGGCRSSNNGGSFVDVRFESYWWSATEYNISYSYFRHLSYYSSSIFRTAAYPFYKNRGYSVRCIKD